MGQGDGDVGDTIGQGEERPGQGEAGDRPGEHMLEVEVSLAELAEILGEELELPRIEPKGAERIVTYKDRYTRHSFYGPRVAEALPPNVQTGSAPPDRHRHLRPQKSR